MANDAMKKTGIFQRIFILYAVVMLLAILFVEIYITAAIRENHIATLRDNLAVQAALIADRISFQSISPLDPACKQLKDKTGARVTVIALDGRVVHGKLRSGTGKTLRRVTLRFVGEDAYWDKNDFPWLNMEMGHGDLKPGDRLNCSLFPLVWSRDDASS
jgi:hypothetical protein